MTHPRMLTVLVTAGLLVSGSRAGAQPSPIPETFTNLTVLPQGLPREQMLQVMRGFSLALGVRCQHCHVGPPGNDLSRLDFAADDKPPKALARRMMAMTASINGTYLADAGLPQVPRTPRVTCNTCHRGERTPRR